MLSPRRDAILRSLVGEYIATATAVGSETIVRKHQLRLRVSPATVRNEMAALEEEGFITRLHASSGEIPLEKGYRYYVESAPPRDTRPSAVRQSARYRFGQVDPGLDAWVNVATGVLAEMVANIAVATFPRAAESRWHHLELVYLQGLFALLVLVFQEATLRKEVITLREPMSQDELTTVANKLNTFLSGRSRAEVLGAHLELSPFETQVRESALHILEREDAERYGDYFAYGLRHLLAQPEFSEASHARTAVEVLEDRILLQQVLSQVPESGEVRVIIGRENSQDALHPFSLVVCQYGQQGRVAGTVGVIGPTCMEYHSTIAGVRYISSLMSELLADTTVE